ncbi:protein phosphatase 2C domain-containing protein [Oleiagrimonas sp. MCCC 1A03011]|uniref:PP2C family protein-serine/threonine phosphatase n=1 Tax=Oleiagrimonas sp. MCCC 1A03011 TaxID=1926883 RepID=UPI000DC3098E|nr:protein phosphatase 2C domain-containing protein [Oleiagrimonas sp. MCCC 1A03011]RAP57621.1 protein phosphatase [Oleiagrimonas sp. MCCC 1A03011]
MIEFGHATHVGLRRTRNEDTYYADPASGVFLVADGLGGHHHGALAAALARDSIVDDLRHDADPDHAIRQADKTLIAHPEYCSEGQPMGTTIALLRLEKANYHAAWVGDSRIYLFADGLLQRLSHDHSAVQEKIDEGLIDEEQARRDPRRNVVTQALGVTAPDDLQIESRRGDLHGSGSFLLCSDGLTEELDDNQLAQCLQRTDLAAQECVDQLILDALQAGGRDNITALLVRIAHN